MMMCDIMIILFDDDIITIMYDVTVTLIDDDVMTMT